MEPFCACAVARVMNWNPTRTAGLERLTEFAPRAGEAYGRTRNFDDGPLRTNVSQLSPWLHAGLLSEAEVLECILAQHRPDDAEAFVSEVFWRVYFKGYLEQRPGIWTAYCRDRDAVLARIEANAGQRTAYREATEGRTGIAAFDLWARELVETGYLHNHARMWFASIWIFTLKLDWQVGADFFLRHLVDGDAASNTLSWRWVAGLHTKGKTYLARADNIARYTERRPQGPLSAEGLAREAVPLEEPLEHPGEALDLPPAPDGAAWDEPFALLLHDEAASHIPLALPRAPALVIGAARPAARSPGPTGDIARAFAHDAVAGGLAGAADAFGCPVREWSEGSDLAAILDEVGIARLAVPHLPIGWSRDALSPSLAPLIEQGRTFTILSDLSRSTWPHARAGFFKVKTAIPDILRELGIVGG